MNILYSTQRADPFQGEPLSRYPKPFLKWAGGKGQLLRQFERFFPQHFHSYYEPFVGSGAVFFHLQPRLAILSDSNPHLIAVYQHIQTSVDDLLTILSSLRMEYHSLQPEQQKQKYYHIRVLYNTLPTGSMEKSAFFIFLNKTGYNGLYRESKRGGYNVPFGRYDNPTLFDEQNMRAVSQALQNVDLRNTHFSMAVETAQAGDFVYFDPPTCLSAKPPRSPAILPLCSIFRNKRVWRKLSEH